MPFHAPSVAVGVMHPVAMGEDTLLPRCTSGRSEVVGRKELFQRATQTRGLRNELSAIHQREEKMLHNTSGGSNKRTACLTETEVGEVMRHNSTEPVISLAMSA